MMKERVEMERNICLDRMSLGIMLIRVIVLGLEKELFG
jgi:hypothetical protein